MTRRLIPVAIIATAAALQTIAGYAFSQDATVGFDVVSIRPSAPVQIYGRELPGTQSFVITDNRVRIKNASLTALIAFAFRVETYQVTGPSISKSALFDVDATMSTRTPRETVPDVMKRMLVARFDLSARETQQERPVYLLSVASKGHKIMPAPPAKGMNAARSDLGGDIFTDTVDLTPEGEVRSVRMKGKRVELTERTEYELTISDQGNWVFKANSMDMAGLAVFLKSRLGGLVVDRTKVTGLFSFTFELPSETHRALQSLGIVTTTIGTPVRGGESPVSVPRSLQSLGLQVALGRAPTRIIVVDSIRQTPTAN